MEVSRRGSRFGFLAVFLVLSSAVHAQYPCSGQWPPDCDDDTYDCRDYKVTWNYLQSAAMVQFQITATQSRNKWCGIGMSTDGEMRNMDVVMGFVSDRGGTIFDGWVGSRAHETPTEDADSSLVAPSISYADGSYVISFMRRIQSSDSEDLSLDQDFYFVYPVGGGTYSPTTQVVRKHSRTPIVASERINFLSCTGSLNNTPSPSPETTEATTTTTTTEATTTATTTTTTTEATTTTATTTTEATTTTATTTEEATTTTATTTTEEATTTTMESTTIPDMDSTTTPIQEDGSTSVSPEPVCENLYTDTTCDTWYFEGECQTNTYWMENNCRKTCTDCDASYVPTMPECENIESDLACDTWFYSGECENNPIWMEDNCRKTCTGCDSSYVPSECVNIAADADCDDWYFRGECTSNPEWMTDNCRKSCTGCDPDYVPSSGDCENVQPDEDCDEWFYRGECRNNMEWMYTNCRKSCGLCDPSYVPEHAYCMNYSPDDLCRHYQSLGDCENNTWYMYDYCRRTCLGCTQACENLMPDDDCEMWHSWGECYNNHQYMNDRCQRTCTLCEDDLCIDKSDECSYLQSIGECEQNPDWMYMNCRETCTECEPACVNVADTQQCLYWASIGECENNTAWMDRNCRKACSDCAGECSNVHDDDDCQGYYDRGECINNPVWMYNNCFRTCSGCDRTAPEMTTGACENIHDDGECETWADRGECSFNYAWMHENCGAACTGCNYDGTCTNINEDNECAYWAYLGECTANPDFMTVNCALSCAACPGSRVASTTYQGGSTTAEMGPWGNIFCQGEKLEVKCPAGYEIRINSGGFYGRRDNVDVCMAAGNTVSMGGDCMNEDVMDELGLLCVGLDSCALYVADAFGDPCPGYIPYLNVSFSCELTVRHQWSCEDTEMHLACDSPDQAIAMEYVSWGRSDGLICTDANMDMDARCSTESAWSYMTDYCNGRSECRILALNETFGDVCPETRRVLEVAYTCGECVDAWEEGEFGEEGDCELYKSMGECDKNPGWMYAYCRKTCTRCHTTDTCFNLHPETEDCEYWAYRGGCISNREWMKTNCAFTCNYCDSVYYPPPSTVGPTTWAPDTMPANTIKEIACNYTNAILTCPAGQHIRIYDAFFGRRDPFICTSGIPETTCDNYVEDTFLIISKLCNGRSSCVLWAGGDPPFEEPCHTTSKYLEVDYACQACENSHDDDECQGWADFYLCPANRFWMTENCYKSCSGCDVAETCTNFLEDRLCDYYASWDQCEDNPGYMHYTCPKSCRTCWIYNN